MPNVLTNTTETPQAAVHLMNAAKVLMRKEFRARYLRYRYPILDPLVRQKDR